MKEHERYTNTLSIRLPRSKSEAYYQAYTAFEKQFGKCKDRIDVYRKAWITI